MSKLKIKNVNYSYLDGEEENKVLKNINIDFESGKFYAIVGESGSGKTTLLSLMSALDNLQEGDILYDDNSMKKIGNYEFRKNYVNVIFQSYNLINYMTAKENVMVAINIGKIKKEDNNKYAYELLKSVGIDKKKADRSVLKLSGGEQQRVAIARAMAQDVPIILADEPTGNLDEKTEEKILNIFRDLAFKDKIVIVVTHSSKLAKTADIIYKLKSGVISK